MGRSEFVTVANMDIEAVGPNCASFPVGALRPVCALLHLGLMSWPLFMAHFLFKGPSKLMHWTTPPSSSSNLNVFSTSSRSRLNITLNHLRLEHLIEHNCTSCTDEDGKHPVLDCPSVCEADLRLLLRLAIRTNLNSLLERAETALLRRLRNHFNFSSVALNIELAEELSMHTFEGKLYLWQQRKRLPQRGTSSRHSCKSPCMMLVWIDRQSIYSSWERGGRL